MASNTLGKGRTGSRIPPALLSVVVVAMAACTTSAPTGSGVATREAADRHPAALPASRQALPSPPPSQQTQGGLAATPQPASLADDARAFRTRHAHFAPAAWKDLPGWKDDDLGEAWRVFAQGCSALAGRQEWTALCKRTALGAPSADQARAFFEQEFLLYEIRNPDGTADGVITGYYEPLLSGSRVRQEAYVYPVYGVPEDMLMLDVRLWPKTLRDLRIPARVEGRQVIPMPGTDSSKAPYLIDVGDMKPDDRDKKLRLRLDGNRLVPYFSRAEIERQGLPKAPVLAWVDDPVALYSMQIQGSGKVRLPDGRMLRLAYAEQNGHPFMPAGKPAGGRAVKSGVTTRGLSVDLADGEVADEETEVAAPAAPMTRGARGVTPPSGGHPSPEVERMIERLAGRAPAHGPAAAGSPARPSAQRPAVVLEAAKAPPPAPRQASARTLAAISADPSFVFFRQIPDGPGGPLGALGVPLTAGRSVAVDPRTTPLGFPVYLSTAATAGTEAVKRLVMAQDTGGAIRGAVRADYFWGFGADAYARAAAMKQNGRMWLLMPRGMRVAARDTPLTRGAADAQSMMDCLVADDTSCVEDR